MVADAPTTLAAIATALPQLETAAWIAQLREQAAELAAAKLVLARSDATPIHPMRLCAEVQARLAPDATLVGDASNMLMWTEATLGALPPGCGPGMGKLGTIRHGV